MNKYLKRTLVVASVMIIIFSIIMLWPLPLRKVLRQETDTALSACQTMTRIYRPFLCLQVL